MSALILLPWFGSNSFQIRYAGEGAILNHDPAKIGGLWDTETAIWEVMVFRMIICFKREGAVWRRFMWRNTESLITCTVVPCLWAEAYAWIRMPQSKAKRTVCFRPKSNFTQLHSFFWSFATPQSIPGKCSSASAIALFTPTTMSDHALGQMPIVDHLRSDMVDSGGFLVKLRKWIRT